MVDVVRVSELARRGAQSARGTIAIPGDGRDFQRIVPCPARPRRTLITAERLLQAHPGRASDLGLQERDWPARACAPGPPQHMRLRESRRLCANANARSYAQPA
jgi:hypothetical protein